MYPMQAMSREQMEAAVQYAAKNNVPFHQARLVVLGVAAGAAEARGDSITQYAARVGQYEEAAVQANLRAASEPAQRRPEASMTRYQHDQALAYARAYGVSWGMARMWALSHVTG